MVLDYVTILHNQILWGLFICSTVDELEGFAIINSSARMFLCKLLGEHFFPFLLDICLGVGLLSHMVCLPLADSFSM